MIFELFIGFKRSYVLGSSKEKNLLEKEEVTPKVTNIHLTQTNIAVTYNVLSIKQSLTAVQVNIGL